MARIFPEVYRAFPEGRDEAERLLYDGFREQLDARWLVFHRCPWLSVEPGRAGGEIGFVLARADLGVLALEVQEGGEPIDDPVRRAVRGKQALLGRLQALPGASKREWTIGHAVASPKVSFEERVAPELVLDPRSLPRLSAWAERALRFWAGPPPGPEGLDLLARLLGHSFEVAPLLASEMRESEREMARLTLAQYSVLDGLARSRRVLISGCAGSGKTLLSLEKARRLADQGFRVLWVCYNRQLRDSSRKHLEGWSRAAVESYHELAQRWARKAGLAVPGPREDPELSLDAYYHEILPRALGQAAARLPAERFDAVIVDEGQDFKASYWRPLEACLRDRARGIFYVFHDDNQALYNGEIRVPRVESRFDLTENLRNTRRIHELVEKYYAGEAKIRARGPAGRKPEVTVYRTPAELLEQVERALDHLTRVEKVPSSQIVVLTAHGREKSAVWRARQLGGLTLVEGPAEKEGQVRWSSIHGFKGLEGAAVILAEVEPLPHTRLDMLLYVGCSRARHHLRVIASEAAARAARLSE